MVCSINDFWLFYSRYFSHCLKLAYQVVGYAVTRLFMIPVVGLVFNQEKFEGDFRFSHVRVRSYAEVISLLRGMGWVSNSWINLFEGDSREHQEAKDRFKTLLQNKLRIVRWHWSVNGIVILLFICFNFSMKRAAISFRIWGVFSTMGL